MCVHPEAIAESYDRRHAKSHRLHPRDSHEDGSLESNAPYTGKVISEFQYEEDMLPFDPYTFAKQGQWQLPGEGKTKFNKKGTAQKCGTTRFKYKCSRGHVANATEICHRATCPVCSKHWQTRLTRRATKRLIDGIDMIRHYPKHYVFSKRFGSTSFEDMKKDLYSFLKRLDIQGALVVFHPFRFRDSQGEPVSYKQWKEAPDVFHRIYSPHFHTLLFGMLPEDYSKTFDRTGWVTVPLGKRARDQIGGTVDYLLSHSGTQTGYQALTWTGALKQMNVIKTKDQVPKLCKHKLANGEACNLQMSEWHIDTLGTGDWGCTEPYAAHWVTNRRHTAKPPPLTLLYRSASSLLRRVPNDEWEPLIPGTLHHHRRMTRATIEQLVEEALKL